jgi:hypothetical protein
MKNYKSISKSLSAKIGVAWLAALLFSSCLKNTNTYYSPPVAVVAFVQASPDEPALDLYFDNDRVNNFPLNYGSTLDYFNVYTGKRNLNLYTSGTMTKVFSDTVTFNQNYAYSIFMANKASSPQILMLTDSISRPADNNASIRFVNLCPDGGPVDLVIKDGATVVANKNFKGFSSFLPIPGNKFYTFEVHKAGTTEVLSTLANVSLNSSFVYTIWFHGLANPTNINDILTTSILTNAYY